jgi:hypothetical protein
MVFNTTCNNISAISWRSVLLVEEIEEPEENSWPVATTSCTCTCRKIQKWLLVRALETVRKVSLLRTFWPVFQCECKWYNSTLWYPNKVLGPDMISHNMLEIFPEKIAIPLQITFNISLQQCTYGSDLNLSLVNYNISQKNNMLPISQRLQSTSCTCTCRKI